MLFCRCCCKKTATERKKENKADGSRSLSKNIIIYKAIYKKEMRLSPLLISIGNVLPGRFRENTCNKKEKA